MKIITTYIPMVYLQILQAYVDLGEYSSRSELFRVIYKDFLIAELELLRDLHNFNFQDQLEQIGGL